MSDEYDKPLADAIERLRSVPDSRKTENTRDVIDDAEAVLEGRPATLFKSKKEALEHIEHWLYVLEHT